MAGKSKTYELAIRIAGKADSSLKKACDEADKHLTALGDSAKKAGKIAATALTAVATAAVAVATASTTAYAQYETAANNMANATGATGEELAHLNDAMKAVYANNYGEDFQDVADAVGLVNRNLKDLPTDQIVGATQSAIALRDAFGYTAEETTRAAAAIEKNFGTAANDAFSLIAAGAQNGLDYSGELIDTINEYSSQFSKLGFTADGMFNLLQSGADSTAWNLDKVGDAIKEFSIRSIDGSDSTVKAFQQLGYNSKELMSTFAAGGESANAAFFDVINTLMDVDNEVQRDAIGVALFGTMWEDLGTEAMQAMANAGTAAYDTRNALKQINTVRYGGLEASLQGVQRQAEAALVAIGEQLAPYAQEGMAYLANVVIPAVSNGLAEIVPQIIEVAKWIWNGRDAILAIAAGIGVAVAAYKWYNTVMTAYNAIMAVYKVVTAVSSASTFTLAGAMTALSWPVLAVVAAIGLAVAAGVLLYKNWDKVKAWAVSLGRTISQVWGNIKAWVSGAVSNLVSAFQTAFPALSAYISGWWESISAAWQNVKAIFTNIIDFVKNVFSGNWSAAWENIINIFQNWFGAIVNLAKAPINGVISAINWMLSGINGISFTIPDWVPGMGGQTMGFDIPTIPMLESGGIATSATQAIVGEGSEPEAILPLSKLASLLESWTDKPKPRGESGGGDVEQIVFSPVFNFYGKTTKEEAVEAGQQSFAEFKRLYKRMKQEEARKSFSPT